MRRRAVVVGAVLSGALLVSVPGTARADEPTVRTDGDTVTYADPALDGEDTTQVRGVLREVVVEHDPREDHASHADAPETLVVTADGTHVPVQLDGDVAASGSTVVARLVQGPALDAALAGEPGEPVPVESARFASAQAAAAPVAHRIYVAIVQNSGSVDATSAIESRVAKGLSWWTAESGASFTRAATVRYSSSAPDRCGFRGANALWSEAASQFPGTSFSASGNHLVVVVDDGCDGTGLGTLGGGMSSGGSVLMTESAGVFTATFAHEVGHNVGLNHANLGTAEYWDLYSPMGLAIGGVETTALDSEYRSQLGIDGADELEVVPAGSSVTRTLAPRGATSGLRGLEVRADGTSYWVEWRSGTERDAQGYYPLEDRGYRVGDGSRRFPRGVTVSTRATGDDGSTSLQGRPDGAVTHGAWLEGQTYTSGDVSVRVDAVTSGGATVTVTNGASLPVVQSAAPTVAGTPQVGEQLTAQTGTWTSGAAFTYQWAADGSAISGATASTFTPSAAQVGRQLTVTVTGSRSGFQSATRTSAPTAAVAQGMLTGPTPTVTGTPQVGVRLVADAGSWPSGTTLTYQWFADGASVAGATGTTFTPSAAERGRAMSVRVTGAKSGYASDSRTSAPTAAVAEGVLASSTPTVTGTAKVGTPLTAAAGTWTAGTTLAYRWLADGAAIGSATGTTFVPTAAQLGKRITVEVTGTRTGYATASRSSGATSPVAAGALRTSTPRVTGTPKVGKKLTASRGTWTSGTTFTYQWLVNGSSVKGATRSTFTLPRSAKGKRVSVKVTGRKAGYTTVTKTSARTATVK